MQTAQKLGILKPLSIFERLSYMRFALCLSLVLALTACGFQLRGVNESTSLKSIFVTGKPIIISKELNNQLKANTVEILKEASSAQVQLDILGEENEKRILSLSGGGVVREFELYYRVQYRTKLANQTVWSEPQMVEARRDFSYSDANLLAKQGEEKRLNENMQSDVLNALIRRISSLKP